MTATVRPRRAVALAAAEAVAAVALLGAAAAEVLTTAGWPQPMPLALLLAAAIALPTGVVSFRPEAAVGTVLGASALQAVLSPTPGSVAELLALIVALTQGSIRVDRYRVPLGVAALATCVLVVFRSEGHPALTDAVFYLLVLLAPPLAGLLVRARIAAAAAARERERWIRAQRRTLAELAVREERARIARELHDVVAHALSAAVVQAVGGRTVLALDAAAAAGAFETIEQVSGRALAELQRLLGDLHDAATAATPSLATLGHLLDDARRAGLAATLSVRGDPAPLSADVELAAYRIVQEALSNAIRYAGAGDARVELDYAGALRLRVSNGPGGERAALPSGGHGIVGMRERAALCGGRASAGPTPDGGFLVEAELPVGAR